MSKKILKKAKRVGLQILLAPVAGFFWVWKKLTTDSSGTWD